MLSKFSNEILVMSGLSMRIAIYRYGDGNGEGDHNGCTKLMFK